MDSGDSQRAMTGIGDGGYAIPSHNMTIVCFVA